MTDVLTEATRAARAAWSRAKHDEPTAKFIEAGNDDESTAFRIIAAAIDDDRAGRPDHQAAMIAQLQAEDTEELRARTREEIAFALAFDRERRPAQ